MAHYGLHRSRLRFAVASLCLAAAILAFPHFSASAAGPCETGGPVGSDTTWSPAMCDPYIVTADLTIQDGATLTLLPGTTLKFAPGKSLIVQGGLKAQGNASQPVLFTSNAASPARGDWGGIFFAPNHIGAAFDSAGNYTGGSILQYAVIAYAGARIPGNSHMDGAVVVDGVSCGPNAPYIDHATVQYSLESGVLSFGKIRITHSIFTNNGTAPLPESNRPSGILTWDCDNLFQDNTVTGNAANGITSYDTKTFETHILVDRNTVSDNLGSGIEVYNGTVTHNTVSGNQFGGISYLDADGSNAIESNVVVNNRLNGTGAGISVMASSDNLAIRGNVIENNTAAEEGGGIYISNNTISDLEISANTITGNHAGTKGGGIYIGGGFGTYTITGNLVAGNIAAMDGGGIYGACMGIYNNQILDNQANPAAGRGGGIYIPAGYHPPINRNDIFHNTAFQGANLFNANPIVQYSAPIDATGNFWLTTDSAAIGRSIYDYSDSSVYAAINFTPFSAKPVNFTWKPVYLPLVRK